MTGVAQLPKHRYDLTPREWEVLGEVAEGYLNPVIAHRLRVGTASITVHVKNAFEKVQILESNDFIGYDRRVVLANFYRKHRGV